MIAGRSGPISGRRVLVAYRHADVSLVKARRAVGGADRLEQQSHRARNICDRWRRDGAFARLHQETQKTPDADIDVALKRKKEME